MRSTLIVARATLSAGLVVGCGVSSAPASDSEAPALAIIEDLRIDGTEHDLVPIGWLGVSPRGEIAFVQGQDHKVRFFTAAGAPAGAIGREGAGPGEFRLPNRGGWLGDTLWIIDTQLDRLTLVAPGPQLLATMQVPPIRSSIPAGGGMTAVHGVYSRDTLLVALIGAATTPTDTLKVGTPVLRITGGGQVVGEVTRYSIEDDKLLVRVQVSTGWQFGQIPFAMDNDWAVSPDGRRVAVLAVDQESDGGPSYTLRVVDDTGNELVNRSLAFSPVPIPQAALDSAVDAVVRRKPAIRRELEAKIRDVAPRFYAEAQSVLLGSDYRIWVGLRRTPSERPWLLLGADGKPVGRLLLPMNSVLRAADAKHIWVVERDSLDLESVVRYRINS